MIILFVVLFVVSLYWLYCVIKSQKMDRMTASLPVPPTMPIVGNGMLFIGDAEKMLRNVEDLAAVAHQNEGCVKIWLGPKLYVAIGNPEDAQVVLENCLDKDGVYRFLRPWLGHGLFIAPVGLWKTHRRVLLPVFHNKIVEEYLGVIAEQSNVLVERLAEQSGKEEFDVFKYITACTLDIVFVFHNKIVEKYLGVIAKQSNVLAERLAEQSGKEEFNELNFFKNFTVCHNKIVEKYLGVIADQSNVLVERLAEQSGKDEFDVLKYITACTLDIVFETAMGERMDVQHTPDTPYLRARHTVMTILNMRFFKVWLQPDLLFNLTPYAKQQKENIDLTHKFTDEVVKKKREEYEMRKNADKKAEQSGKLRAVLDLLFGREIEFTDEQLREHIDSITIAGNDTTALVIAYTLVLLGVHQDVQEKVLLEQESILGSSKRGVDKDDIQKMHYLERVIKESMRLYTVVPIIARTVDKNTYLPNCKVTIPAGAGAVVGAFAVHRSEKVWGPNANEFDPDRFLPERSADRHPASFIPFSYGSRNCIGRNFGMLIMKSIISTVVRSYKISAKDIGRLKIEILLFPIKGHLLRIEKR